MMLFVASWCVVLCWIISIVWTICICCVALCHWM